MYLLLDESGHSRSHYRLQGNKGKLWCLLVLHPYNNSNNSILHINQWNVFFHYTFFFIMELKFYKYWHQNIFRTGMPMMCFSFILNLFMALQTLSLFLLWPVFPPASGYLLIKCVVWLIPWWWVLSGSIHFFLFCFLIFFVRCIL